MVHVQPAQPAPAVEFSGRERSEGNMKEAVVETLLIGSGSQEEADRRVQVLLDLGVSRGYLTYEELNEKLPDEVVSPDKLDTLLMRIDEMGIKLIDEFDIADYQKGRAAGARRGQGLWQARRQAQAPQAARADQRRRRQARSR
jgi:hypothetical protein